MKIFKEDISLLGRNSMGFNVRASYWAEFSTCEQLVCIIEECRKRSLPWYVLGGGSNVILTGNFPGVYIHPVSGAIEHAEDTLLVADAGVVWDDFVLHCVERGLWGVENLSLIPGQVGAAPVQNIGAYGVEAKDTVEWVEYLDTDSLQLKRISASECRFGYRDSIFKQELRGKAIVVRVAFRLNKEPLCNLGYGDLCEKTEAMGGATLENIRRAVIEIRRSKLPDPEKLGNAGSFFKNPVIDPEKAAELKKTYPEMPAYDSVGGVKISAAWLIDRTGWKGRRCGTVGVHDCQPLVLVNYGSATAAEIISLGGRIRDDVRRIFDIEIEQEVNIL